MSNLAPGSYVQEVTSPTYASTSPSTTRVVFVESHNQGPTVPVLLQSWRQFQAIYGGFGPAGNPSALALAVYFFFLNGGGQCYAIRVVHTDAVVASTELFDTEVTPAATLVVSAANPGSWGNAETIAVNAHTTTSTYDLIVNGGAEVWAGLSMSLSSPQYGPAVVNDPNLGSNLIRLTDLHGTLTTPGFLPATVATEFLGTGIGGVLGADGSAVTPTDITATTSLIDPLNGPLVLNVPGATDVTNIINPLINYASAQRSIKDLIVVADVPPNENPAGLTTYQESLTPSSYGVSYGPQIMVSDPSSARLGAQRQLPVVAEVLGQWAVTDANRGIQKSPAGEQTTISALSVQYSLSPADIGNLNALNLNCIRKLPGAGIVVWGARTLSNVASLQYITKRRLLIAIEHNALALTAFAAFENNDWVTWNQITQRLDSYLGLLQAQGAFAGQTSAQSYYIICDASNNTYLSNTINVAVGVALSDPTEFVNIAIGQWNGGTTLASTINGLPIS